MIMNVIVTGAILVFVLFMITTLSKKINIQKFKNKDVLYEDPSKITNTNKKT
jgi:hypothetical protein